MKQLIILIFYVFCMLILPETRAKVLRVNNNTGINDVYSTSGTSVKANQNNTSSDGQPAENPLQNYFRNFLGCCIEENRKRNQRRIKA